MSVDINTLFTEKRFKTSKSEVTKILEELDDSTSNYKKLIERVLDEDIQLKIRFKTFKKCRRNFLLSCVAIVVGAWFGAKVPALYLLLVIGVLVLISSVIGMIKNRLSSEKRKYLRS